MMGQSALARGDGFLGPLQVLDAHEHDVHAHDRVARADRHVVQARPLARIRAVPRLPVEGERLAGQRLEERLAPAIGRWRAMDLVHRVADQLAGGAPEALS